MIISTRNSREKENDAAHYSKIKLRDLFPVNFLSEREKFFELNGEYCPYFLYNNIVYLEASQSPQIFRGSGIGSLSYISAVET